MVDALRSLLLRLLAVPAEPHPPGGDPSRARIFRAAPAYFNYRLVLWGLRQLGAFLGLVGAVVAIYYARQAVDDRVFDIAMSLFEGAAWAVYLIQLPISLGVLRLDFEMRWYIVAERALRVREGILAVREQTMTFANVQQVGIRQGPLQRLLGIADVHVTTAGGGGSQADFGKGLGGGMHEVYFRGVDNAQEIREAIRRRTYLHRDAGLGDPDDNAQAPRDLAPALDAAGALLAEVRSLRRALAVIPGARS
jgi:membrane protein YdbS with pleckstrin-like domain